MANGANSIHKYLRTELENYIKSQYFGKSPILLSSVVSDLDSEGLLYQKPYIESSPAYKSTMNGIQKADIPEWLTEANSNIAFTVTTKEEYRNVGSTKNIAFPRHIRHVDGIRVFILTSTLIQIRDARILHHPTIRVSFLSSIIL